MTRASAVLDRNVLVRLVGYRNGTEEAGAGFRQTWSSVARARRPSDPVYRDLVRQVPDWNAWIARQIQESNSFEFPRLRRAPPRRGRARGRRPAALDSDVV